MVTGVLVTSYVTLLVTCLAEPPSRLNLFRFFMGFGPETNSVRTISFNPEAGLRYREQYQKKYGPRGASLIEMFGKGMRPENLDNTDIELSETKSNKHQNQDINSSKSKTKKARIEKNTLMNINSTQAAEVIQSSLK